MQILLHADPNIDGGAAMSEHLNKVVIDALGRFGERVIRVEAHLSDQNGKTKSGDDDIRCLLEATLVGEPAIVVKAQSGNAHQAIAEALRKLKRAIGTAIDKHDPQRQYAHEAAPEQST
ncbi:MAG: HPF/RaiA family ribosome-associated protein [Rubrivivax sp.]|nr:HPF/RaiA family ribosome-associated protein [Rubrivivax sp.]